MNDVIDVCIKESLKSLEHGDVPIGAVVMHNGQKIAQSHNTRQRDCSILGHAEINAIILASAYLKTWNLSDCDLYVTLKPCSMCETIIKQSRIRSVYYLLDKLDYKKEYSKTSFHKIITESKHSDEQMYHDILADFFKDKR